MLGLKESDSNIIIILYNEKGQWYGVDHIKRAVIINQTVQPESISIVKKVNTRSFECCIVCPSKMSLDKATWQRSELLDHSSYTSNQVGIPISKKIGDMHRTQCNF